MKYAEQLKTSKWINKKSKILKRDKYTCTNCKVNDLELHVHHLYYISGNMAWDYPENALITLCIKCHKEWHKKFKIEIRKKVWCKNAKYKPNKQEKRQKKKTKKKDKIINLAKRLGLDINLEVVQEIVNSYTYSRAHYLFKKLLESGGVEQR